MKPSDVQSLIITIDDLIFSHTGEHLDDMQYEILEGVIGHQKYAEIAQKNNRSQKYVKETAGKLWKMLSEILEEDVNKSNLKSSIQRYYYSTFSNSNIINSNSIKIHGSHICTGLSENELQQFKLNPEAKLEIATELIKEGLTVEQIAKVLKLPLELVKDHFENAN